LTVAAVLLAVGILSVYAAIGASTAMYGIATEQEIAAAAAQEKAGEMAGVEYDHLYLRYAPGSPGEYFAVEGLVVPTGRPGAGRVVYLRESETGSEVQQLGVDTFFGTPRDLNGDGDTEDGPSPETRILPVVIEIAYQSRHEGGEVKTLRFPTAIIARQIDPESP
jgi:hypothetical protein